MNASFTLSFLYSQSCVVDEYWSWLLRKPYRQRRQHKANIVALSQDLLIIDDSVDMYENLVSKARP
jgi:hypothetical protein